MKLNLPSYTSREFQRKLGPPLGGGISVWISPRVLLSRNVKPVDKEAVTGGVLTFALLGSDSNNFEVFWTACRTVSFDIGVNPEIGLADIEQYGKASPI
jgi:hypothetical protein